MFPKPRHFVADRVYRGPKPLHALADLGAWTIEIVTRSQSIGTFKPEARRWVVERTFAWFGRNRRLAKDFEATIASAEAWVTIPAFDCSHAVSQGLEAMDTLSSQTLRSIDHRPLRGNPA